MGISLRRYLRNIGDFISRADHSPLRQGPKGPFVFVHINKTGGTSIADAIGLPSKRHLTVKEIIELIGSEAFHSAYSFAVVRNPWSKVVSHYKYRIKTNKNDLAKRTIPFKSWVEKTYGPNKDPKYYDRPRMFQTQLAWLRDERDELHIDRILRFENLSEQFNAMSKEIGLELELPHLNQTKKEDYRSYYDEQSRAIIADWFKEDIEAFGYRFEQNEN